MIRFIKSTFDKKEPKKKFNIGDEIDLGKERNESAVKRGLAEFVEAKPAKEKEETTKAPKATKAEK